ncbi:MAG: hypothetical protein RLZZ241_1375 [Bacteroidota bacterium]|jgi:hypothetical protein
MGILPSKKNKYPNPFNSINLMTMKKIMLFIFSFSLITVLSAQVGKRIKGNGNLITLERNVGPYDGIALSGWFNVALVEGAEGLLTLEGDENLLEHLETIVKNGTLHIRTEKGYQLQSESWNSKTLTVKVPIASINEISLSGSGEISGTAKITSDFFRGTMSGSGKLQLNLETSESKINVSGSGNLNLSGTSNKLDVHISGSGDFRGFEFDCQDVSAVISGSANMRITAIESLTARVSGSGNIYYRGNPKHIDTKTSGSGEVKPQK